MIERLTLQSIRARPVVLKLERPIVARIATITDWPVIVRLSSLARNSMRFATSSGVEMSRTAVAATSCERRVS